jgi:hypothetical protein
MFIYPFLNGGQIYNKNKNLNQLLKFIKYSIKKANVLHVSN